MSNNYGYIRVSTKEQNEDRQVIALHEAGLSPRHIFMDKTSGKDFNRPQYRQMMKKLKPGDVLFIKSIDRLGRNYAEILEEWRRITKELQVSVVVLDIPLLDTRKDSDLTRTLIADIVLQLLSYVAQIEREFIHTRQAEGIAAAKAKGIKFGPKPLPVSSFFPDVYEEWKAKKISARKAGTKLGISYKTFQKWCNEIEKT